MHIITADRVVTASDIISGVRLPYEEQSKLDGHDQDENSDDDKDDFFSDDEDEEDSDEGVPLTELDMRFKEIVDIVDNLYKVGKAPIQYFVKSIGTSESPKVYAGSIQYTNTFDLVLYQFDP